MKFKTLLLVALAALLCVDGSARARKKKLTPQVTEVNPVKPVPADSFSYAMGVAQSESLKQYLMMREGVDSAYLAFTLQAIREYQGLTEEHRAQILAYAAGLRIGEMNEKNVIPSLNLQATGQRDTTYTNPAKFIEGLVDGINGTSALKADSALKVAERQIEFHQNELRIANAQWLAANAQLKGVKVLPSGLQYRVLTAGSGICAADTSEVEVHYEGRLIDGTVFDSSYKRGQPATFRCNQVIKGWTEALQLMPEGSTWELYIPYNLAYGERGNQSIPPYATLIFKVEVLKVKTPESTKPGAAITPRQ